MTCFRFVGRLQSHRLVERLACGMTPVEVAAAAMQPESAERLRAHGAVVDVLSACALGWRDRLADLVRETPDMVSWARPANGPTALHVAAYDNGVELVTMLLDLGADTTVTDARFHSTPAGWARLAGHLQSAALIESRQS